MAVSTVMPQFRCNDAWGCSTDPPLLSESKIRGFFVRSPDHKAVSGMWFKAALIPFYNQALVPHFVFSAEKAQLSFKFPFLLPSGLERKQRRQLCV